MQSVVVSSLEAFALNSRDVETATKSDKTMRRVLQNVREGWSRDNAFNGELACFYARKDALCEVGGCLLFGERVVMPSALRQRCLRQLHHGHPGVQRMKSLARSYVYWPMLDKEIAELVATCNACSLAAKSPPRSSPVPWPEVTTPWQRVHVDYAGPIDGYSFLIAVDAFSKWPEIIRTVSTTSTATIRILRRMFARYGMPVTLVSDNGRQFTSAEFEEFCTCNGIEHLTSAPFHPQSNGQAERFVDTFKRAIGKISSDGTTIKDALEIFLQTYRATPNPQAPNSKAPATIMFGRQIRTCLELIRP
uniref:RNA-directed DNA polymerase n=1 Tax=Anopheles atroparvus TaxID=41427 RepID=A0AAG5DNZ1_ANOAO